VGGTAFPCYIALLAVSANIAVSLIVSLVFMPFARPAPAGAE
jgi:hypothetical protein